MAQLTRDALLKKQVLKIEKVEFDDGDFVHVKQMTGRARDNFEQSLMDKVTDKDGVVSYERNLLDFRAKLAVCTICDEEGNLLLTSSDISILSEAMSAARLESIVNAAQELNKITKKDKENLLKNSAPDQTDDSTSA